MRDPFAPRMDLSYPSLRGQTKIHKWSKWITNGRTFHCSGEQISRRKQLYKLRMGLCSTFRNYEVHQNQIFPEITTKNREKPVKIQMKIRFSSKCVSVMLKTRLCIEKTHVFTIKLKEPKKPGKPEKTGGKLKKSRNVIYHLD